MMKIKSTIVKEENEEGELVEKELEVPPEPDEDDEVMKLRKELAVAHSMLQDKLTDTFNMNPDDNSPVMDGEQIAEFKKLVESVVSEDSNGDTIHSNLATVIWWRYRNFFLEAAEYMFHSKKIN